MNIIKTFGTIRDKKVVDLSVDETIAYATVVGLGVTAVSAAAMIAMAAAVYAVDSVATKIKDHKKKVEECETECNYSDICEFSGQ